VCERALHRGDRIVQLGPEHDLVPAMDHEAAPSEVGRQRPAAGRATPAGVVEIV